MTTPVRIAVAGIACLLVALVAWSVGADRPEDAEHRQKIATMSEERRELLRRRYEAFHKLPDDEQQAIRDLHEATAKDPGLADTLSDYESFVSHLELWDQQELREIDDPAKRVAQVRRLIADRHPREDHGRPSWLSGRGSERYAFTPSKFDEAITTVAGLLDLSTKEKAALDAMDEPHRHLRIAELAANRFRTQPRWPDKADFERIVKLLPDDGYREMLLRDKFPEEFRRNRLGYSLVKSLLAEWQEVIRREVPPEQMRQALGALNDREQSEMSRRDPDRLMYEIMKKLAEGDDDTAAVAQDFVKVAKLKAGFDFPNMGRGGWPGGNRDGGNRPGPGGRDGGPDGTRRDGGRGDGPPPPGFPGGPRRFGGDRDRPEGPDRHDR